MAVSPHQLNRFDLFIGLPESFLEAIVPLAVERRCPDGTVLFSEGTPARELFLILAGRVALDKRVQLGRTGTPRHAPIEVVGPWQAVGWSSLVRPYEYTSSGSCQGETTVLVIPGERLLQMMLDQPDVGYEILNRVASIVRHRMESSTGMLTYFLSVISHEIKRPLAAVESNLQLILGGYSGTVEDKQRRLLERSSLRLTDLRALISDVVDFARMQPSQIRSDFEMVDPARLSTDAVEDVRLAAQQKSIQIKVVSPGKLQPLVAARRRLGQVVSNLLANAVKFSPEGSTVLLRAHDEPEALVLEVLDEGIGIPAGDQPHVFEDFFRGENAEGYGGAGLGLSIAKKIVSAHDGTIEIASPYQAGKSGTKFTVRIPRSLAQATESPSVPSSVDAEGLSDPEASMAPRRTAR
ncbi:MAG TPA: ATP-binding protein [Anaerolineales bacterium]|nr:ATP-binding protein [Anaerolineales bacterium]